jgi:VCBS repeat-containing protein
MTRYLGDFYRGATFDFKFNTIDDALAPITLAGTPSLTCYKDNDTTQDTSGLTLSVDFDSVTGKHNVRVDLTSDTAFYTAGSSYQVAMAAGTVDSISVVGRVIAEFTIERDPKIIRSGTLPGATGQTTTNIRIDSGAAAADDALNTMVLGVVSGGKITRAHYIKDYTEATGDCTVDTMYAALGGTEMYVLYHNGIAAATAPANFELMTINGSGQVVASSAEALGAQAQTDVGTGVLAAAVESTYNIQEVIRLMASVLLGLSTDGNLTFTGLDGTTTRVTFTIDGSDNRSAVVLDAS